MTDGGIEFGVVGTAMVQEPAPELVVFASEQAFEPGAFQRFRIRPTLVQIAFEQLIEFAHAASTVPTQAALLGIAGYHGRTSAKRIQNAISTSIASA
jgi:hypothetical protein